MPASIVVGQNASSVLQGVDQNGNPFPLDATYRVQYTASVPADVTISTPNPDGSAILTGVAVDPGDQIGAIVTRPDGTPITFTPDTLVITAPAPVLTGGAVALSATPSIKPTVK